jgi:DNA-binding beta-propeller fold protein YncE
MKSKLSILCILLVTASLCAFASEPPKYRILQHFAVGGEGFWDYLVFDSQGHRLFITRGTHVIVLDPDTGKQTGEIPNTDGVHGVALVPELGVGLTSNGRANTVTIFDLKTLKPKGEVRTGTNPDAIMYDPASKRVFAFDGRSQEATVIDPAKAAAIGTIPLGGKPEFGVSDEKGHVFVNIEDKSEIAEIDSRNMKVLAKWPLAPCEEPSGLAIDKNNGRLFAVCSNQKMAVVDSSTGKVVATVPIGRRPDAAAFDRDTQLVFSSNGEGNLTVVHQDSPDQYTVLQTLDTAVGARTMALDPATHKIYLVTAKFGPPPAPTAEQPHPRPTMLANSFEVIVVGPK